MGPHRPTIHARSTPETTVTEIPEHLLARSRARRAAMGGDSGGEESGATAPAPAASAAPAPTPAPAAPAEPEPEP
ncbi:MAG: hypothetical protein D6683_08645, partial [Actinomyces sp.]